MKNQHEHKRKTQPLKHTYIHVQTHTYTNKIKRIIKYTNKHMPVDRNSQIHIHYQQKRNTDKKIDMNKLTYNHTHKHKHTQTHTQKHTHKKTHTYTKSSLSHEKKNKYNRKHTKPHYIQI